MKYQISISCRLILNLLLIILLSNSLSAQQDSLTLFESLYGEEIPHFHIKTKLKQIIRKKAKKENHVGMLTYQDKDGQQQEFTISTIEQFELLNKKQKKSMLQYLDSFFEILDAPKACNSKIVKHCNRHIKMF